MKTIVLSDAASNELSLALGVASPAPTFANGVPYSPQPTPTVESHSSYSRPADPYNPPGLDTVIMQVGTPGQYAAAQRRLGQEYDQTARGILINTNANADPTWNAVLAQLVAGKSPEDAFKIAAKGYDGNYLDPSFTLDDVKRALSRFFA